MSGDLFSGSPAHLQWIAGVLRLARNANMDRIILLECQLLLPLVLVTRYVRRKKKLEKMRTRRKYWVRSMLQGPTNHDQYHTLFAELRHPRFRHFPPPFWSHELWGKLSCYIIHSVADLRRWCSHKLFSSPTIAGLPAKLNSAQLRRQAGGQWLGQIMYRR